MNHNNLNSAFLIGRLGKDPEVTTIKNGNNVCKLSLATSSSYKDQSGQYIDQVEWHSLEAWGKTSELINSILKKGALIFCEGRLKTNSWINKEGYTQYKTVIVVSRFTLIKKNNKSQAEDVIDEF